MNVRYVTAQKALVPLGRVATSQSLMAGLLGNNDKIPDNDLKPKGASVHINPNSTQREIFENFGQSCK